MKQIENVFFDLDRTLWDFETNSKVAIENLFEELKLSEKIASFDSFHATYRKINGHYWDLYSKGGITKEELRSIRFIDTLKSFDIADEKLGIQLGDLYIKTAPYQTHLFPDTISTLQTLKEADYKLHIITNGFKEVQFIKLQKSGLIDFFDDILCSEEVGKNKPHPSVFKTALERNKAKSDQSIMIGDDFQADVLGAESCGIQGVLFDPNNNYKARNEITKIINLNQIHDILLGI